MARGLLMLRLLLLLKQTLAMVMEDMDMVAMGIFMDMVRGQLSLAMDMEAMVMADMDMDMADMDTTTARDLQNPDMDIMDMAAMDMAMDMDIMVRFPNHSRVLLCTNY